jgi:Tfp pilus assembly protein PilZ
MATSDSLRKKRETRVTINKEFESFDSFINEYVTNVSRSGAFVKCQHPLEIGTEINLNFAIIADSVVNIEGVGKVVRVEREPPGMGVVFTEINQHSRRLLERLLTLRESGKNKSRRP